MDNVQTSSVSSSPLLILSPNDASSSPISRPETYLTSVPRRKRTVPGSKRTVRQYRTCHSAYVGTAHSSTGHPIANR
eukprot:3786787-Rhodomonas_salina.1